VFDADEFLCIKHGDGTLDDLIGALKARGASGGGLFTSFAASARASRTSPGAAKSAATCCIRIN